MFLCFYANWLKISKYQYVAAYLAGTAFSYFLTVSIMPTQYNSTAYEFISKQLFCNLHLSNAPCVLILLKIFSICENISKFWPAVSIIFFGRKLQCSKLIKSVFWYHHFQYILDPFDNEEFITYRQMYEEVCQYAISLRNIGVKKGDCVACKYFLNYLKVRQKVHMNFLTLWAICPYFHVSPKQL